MKCTEIREAILEAVIINGPVSPVIREHLDACPECRREWETMRSTLALLDTWEAPEPSPFFDTKMQARLRAEVVPVGWRERLQAALNSVRERHIGWRPVTAVALAVAMAVGIGIYESSVPTPKSKPNGASAVVDLQALDKNQQLLNEMSILDQSASNTDTGTTE